MSRPDGAIEVPLTQGKVALVDAADAPSVLAHKWCAAEAWPGIFYAKRGVRRPDGTKTTTCMHTFLTGWQLVDHANGNGLDNRRSNLREATVSQNSANSRRSTRNRSGFKGVSWDKARSKWRATIQFDGHYRNIGRYPSAEDAARAYDAAAREHFGEFARLNFPEETP